MTLNRGNLENFQGKQHKNLQFTCIIGLFSFFFIAQKENKDYILLANMCLLEYTQMTLFVEFSAEDSLGCIQGRNQVIFLGKQSQWVGIICAL